MQFINGRPFGLPVGNQRRIEIEGCSYLYHSRVGEARLFQSIANSDFRNLARDGFWELTKVVFLLGKSIHDAASMCGGVAKRLCLL